MARVKNKITQRMLVKKISNETGHSQKEITDIINSLKKNITEYLKNGMIVELIGLGKFFLFHRHGRKCPHPLKKGKKITLNDEYIPKYKAGKKTKDEVNFSTSKIKSTSKNLKNR